MKAVVLISANSEWRAVKEFLAPAEISASPFGEFFSHTWRMDWEPFNLEALFFHSGWGKVSAAAATQYVIDCFEPSLIVNLGTCGGFAGRIQRGTLVLVERTIIYDIFEQMSDPEEAVHFYTTDLDLSWLAQVNQNSKILTQPLPMRTTMVSADRDIIPADISMLVEKFNAVAADWESGAIAWVAKKNAIRCLIARGVTDLVDTHGGEAYGKIEIFRENTRSIMRDLIGWLPEWLARCPS